MVPDWLTLLFNPVGRHTVIRTFRLMCVPVVLAVLVLGLVFSAAAETVPLIFDTDMGNDVDDALALGLIHTFQHRGDCRLLAVTLTKDHRYAAPFVDLVNTFYGYGEIPIGVVRGGVTRAKATIFGKWPAPKTMGSPAIPTSSATAARPRRPRPCSAGVGRPGRRLRGDRPGRLFHQPGPAARLEARRSLAAGRQDAGPAQGAAADRDGRQLRRGARRAFQGIQRGDRHRLGQKLFQQWPTPIVVSGFEVGNAILYPHRSIEQDYKYVPHHPVAEAYKLYRKMPYDRPTWDLTAVLYAVRPDGVFRPVAAGPGGGRGRRGHPLPGRSRRSAPLSDHCQPGAGPAVRDAFVDLCSERPAGVTEREKQQAEADRRRKVRSTRTTPGSRVQLENQALRLDFDPRTSGTDYNYISVRRPGTDRWERVHNFGVDVGSYDSGDQWEMNCIGMNLSLKREGRTMKSPIPSPLVQYRQFDDRIGTPELIRKYPDFTADDTRRLVHADASIEFRYEIDPERPSFVVSGRVLAGADQLIVYIVDALWTNNHFLPTHELVEGQPEYDPSPPEGKKACAQVAIEKVHYAIFYRRDGEGVPFALLPLLPDRARVCNYFDNWKCLYDFHTSELNQQYVPDDPPVTGANDTGYITVPRADGTFAAVRVAFFPELGWGQGGKGDELRRRIVRALKTAYPAAW